MAVIVDSFPCNVVTAQAVVKRLNRKLRPLSQAIRKNRGAYYLLDVQRSLILADRLNLEAIARESNVLESYEQIGAQASLWAT